MQHVSVCKEAAAASIFAPESHSSALTSVREACFVVSRVLVSKHKHVLASQAPSFLNEHLPAGRLTNVPSMLQPAQWF